MTDLYPLLLQPALHVKVWGGRQLESRLHKPLPPDNQPYGEAWELHDSATVTNGALAGQTLGEVMATYGAALIGAQADESRGIPLLAKFLDSTTWLSVQVHPSDDQSEVLEGERRGKTEAWYIIHAEPGAQLIIGVKPGTTNDAIAEAIRVSKLEDLLEYATVRAGDVLFVKTGTIHALGPGILLYEIQQSSDMTYRLYDWGRVGLDGQPRQLHVEKSLAVANTDSLPDILHTGDNDSATVEIARCEFFTTTLHQLNHHTGTHITLETGGHFQALTCIEGVAVVTGAGEEVALETGRTMLIPASLDSVSIDGATRILRSAQA